LLQAWLKLHDNSLGHFVNGKWVKPENRKTYVTVSPATGDELAETVQVAYT